MLVFLFRFDGLCLRIDSNLFPQAQVLPPWDAAGHL